MTSLPRKKTSGFTIIELTLVVSIIFVLLTLTTFNLFKSQSKVSLSSFSMTLISDIKQQQTKAMAGDSEGRATHDAYGIYFENNRYIFFHGPEYIPSDPGNFIITNNDNLIFSNIDLPNSKLIFASVSGELADYDSNHKSITISTSINDDQKIIFFNRYGIVVDN